MHGDTRNAYTILVGHLSGRDSSEDVNKGGRIILKWISRKAGWRLWTGFIWLRTRGGGGFL
jgi:hypothetical protein